MFTIQQRHKVKLKPKQHATGLPCAKCGNSKPYKVIHGKEICCGCGKPLPTAREFRALAFRGALAW